MKRTATLILVTTLAFGLATAWAVSASARGPVFAAYGYAVELVPDDGSDHVYRCEVTVFDLETEETVYRPRLLFNAGESGTLEMGVKDTGTLLEIKASVSADEQTGHYQITFREEGRLVGSHSASVRLAASEDGGDAG